MTFLLDANVLVALCAAEHVEVLGSVTGHRRHEFWSDDAPFSADMLRGVVGHRQVTDAYLANQARQRGGKIATLDSGLAALHADVATLVT